MKKIIVILFLLLSWNLYARELPKTFNDSIKGSAIAGYPIKEKNKKIKI